MANIAIHQTRHHKILVPSHHFCGLVMAALAVPFIHWETEMRRSIPALVSLMISITGCGEADTKTDNITLHYLNAKIYPDSAIACDLRRVSNRDFIGCYGKSMRGRSNIHLWQYQDGRYLAINGTARRAAEIHFSDHKDVVIPPLPLSKEIDIGKVLTEFQ